VKALIIGVSGQDGAYLAKSLLDKGYAVYGSSRDANASTFRNLERLGILDRVQLVSISIVDFRSVLQTLTRIAPDEVYNLAGQTSVGLSFDQPVETLESISLGTLNILEAIRFTGAPTKFYNAGSVEIFGDTGERPADERTSFRPKSPYAVAKAAALWTVATYRQAYGLFACTGILGNHESPLRPERFVTRKIISAAHRISNGRPEKLRLGNIHITRDWGWAPDYVEAMWLMLQQEHPDDFVIATGQMSTLEDFIAMAFMQFGLEWQNHVEVDPAFFRPNDIAVNCADPTKAGKLLGWRPKHFMADVVRLMVAAESSKQLDVVSG
jgi:GDPmannose 4,6-dehydratase